jgi:hypothetical protein
VCTPRIKIVKLHDLKLKTWPKPLLGPVLLDICSLGCLPGLVLYIAYEEGLRQSASGLRPMLPSFFGVMDAKE